MVNVCLSPLKQDKTIWSPKSDIVQGTVQVPGSLVRRTVRTETTNSSPTSDLQFLRYNTYCVQYSEYRIWHT